MALHVGIRSAISPLVAEVAELGHFLLHRGSVRRRVHHPAEGLPVDQGGIHSQLVRRFHSTGCAIRVGIRATERTSIIPCTLPYLESLRGVPGM